MIDCTVYQLLLVLLNVTDKIMLLTLSANLLCLLKHLILLEDLCLSNFNILADISYLMVFDLNDLLITHLELLI